MTLLKKLAGLFERTQQIECPVSSMDIMAHPWTGLRYIRVRYHQQITTVRSYLPWVADRVSSVWVLDGRGYRGKKPFVAHRLIVGGTLRAALALMDSKISDAAAGMVHGNRSLDSRQKKHNA